MRLSGQNVLHSGAVQWYYDVVAGYAPGVPEAMIRHIRQCWICRKRIHRLKEAVTGAGGETDESRSEMKRDVIDTLSLHFGCLDEQVTCSRVKPFLPGLLMPSVQIRIPTPITVHIDHCPECAEDLEVLGDLGLSAEQLERLQRLYEHGLRGEGILPLHSGLDGRIAACRSEAKMASPHKGGTPSPRAAQSQENPRLCRRAKSQIAAFVRGSLDDIDGEILDHLCTCPRCRRRVFRSRHKLLDSGRVAPPNLFDGARGGGLGRPKAHGQTSLPVPPDGMPVTCGGDIPMAQLFDYAIPYGRTIAGQERAGESHVRACRACLTRIRVLDETVYGIAERTNSGVATVYSTIEREAQQRCGEAQPASRIAAQAREAEEIAGLFAEPYPEYPIHVQVIHGEPERVAAPAWSPARVKAALNRTTCNPRVRLILKTAVAVAAMIPLALLFHGTTSTTSGITLAQVFKAFGKAENVHVSRFYPATGQLTRELWISRTMNVVLTTAGQKTILYDLGTKKKYAYPASGARADVVDLGEREYVNSRRDMDGCLGFTLNDVPSSATWTRVDDNGAEDLETYELTYSELALSGATAFRKLKITIDPTTKLPREVQRFRRAPSEDEWDHQETTKLQYLTEVEIKADLEEQHFRNGSEAH
jgi:hypothetical protein